MKSIKNTKEVYQPLQKILNNDLVQEIERFIIYPQDYTIYEGDNLEVFFSKCNIGDKITYLTNNQLGTCTYKVIKNRQNNKDIELIHSMNYYDIDYYDYLQL